jgi:hypothetical protein
MRNLEYYAVENTGWSNGVSWFTTGGTDTNPLRFKTFDEALDYTVRCKKELNDPATLWRIVWVTVVRTEESKVTVENYIRV